MAGSYPQLCIAITPWARCLRWAEMARGFQWHLWHASAQTFRELSTGAPVFPQLSTVPREKADALGGSWFCVTEDEGGQIESTNRVSSHVSLVVNLGHWNPLGCLLTCRSPDPVLQMLSQNLQGWVLGSPFSQIPRLSQTQLGLATIDLRHLTLLLF